MGRNFALKTSQIRQAAALYRAGLSRRQIAAHFAVSDTAVGNALRLVGQRFRQRAYAAALALSKNPEKHYQQEPR